MVEQRRSNNRREVVSRKHWKLFIAVITAATLPLTVLAGEDSGVRTITSLGCDNVDSICSINVSGAPIGASVGCSSNTIAWDSMNDPNGKSTLATLLAAFGSGKQIEIYVNSCLAARPSFPTIWYINVYP
jgi:hypothetical protein